MVWRHSPQLPVIFSSILGCEFSSPSQPSQAGTMNQSRSGDSLLYQLKHQLQREKNTAVRSPSALPCPGSWCSTPLYKKSPTSQPQSPFGMQRTTNTFSARGSFLFYHKSKEGKNSCKVHSREQTRR